MFSASIGQMSDAHIKKGDPEVSSFLYWVWSSVVPHDR